MKTSLAGCQHVVCLKNCLEISEEQYCSTFYKVYALFEHPQRTLDDEIRERIVQNNKFNQP